MTAFAKALLAGAAISLLAAAANAQDAGNESQRAAWASAARDRIQEFELARSAALHRAWLAAGHTEQPPAAPPKILSGKILTRSLNVSKGTAAPEYTVKFKTGLSGLSYIGAYFYPPAGGHYLYVSYDTPYKAPAMTEGTITIQEPGDSYGQGALDTYSPPGTWTLEEVYIDDRAGHSTDYQGAQLAALFPSATIMVSNPGKPDTTPPAVSAGKILTPKISLASGYPVFSATVTVSDDLSGVHYGYISVLSPTGEYGDCCTYPSAPIVNGKLTIDSYLGDSPTTGTWKITEYEVCDVAGNCTESSNASDIQTLLGATTFKVTK